MWSLVYRATESKINGSIYYFVRAAIDDRIRVSIRNVVASTLGLNIIGNIFNAVNDYLDENE